MISILKFFSSEVFISHTLHSSVCFGLLHVIDFLQISLTVHTYEREQLLQRDQSGDSKHTGGALTRVWIDWASSVKKSLGVTFSRRFLLDPCLSRGLSANILEAKWGRGTPGMRMPFSHPFFREVSWSSIMPTSPNRQTLLSSSPEGKYLQASTKDWERVWRCNCFLNFYQYWLF